MQEKDIVSREMRTIAACLLERILTSNIKQLLFRVYTYMLKEKAQHIDY